MKQTSAMTFREVDHLPPMRIDSIKKKIVAADMAIEISQKEYPTKSPDWSIIESPEAGGLNVSIRFRSNGITIFSHTWFKKKQK